MGGGCITTAQTKLSVVLIPQRPELELRRCLSSTVAPTDIIQIKRSHCAPGWPRYSPESTSSRSDETRRNRLAHHSSRLTLASAPPAGCKHTLERQTAVFFFFFTENNYCERNPEAARRVSSDEFTRHLPTRRTKGVQLGVNCVLFPQLLLTDGTFIIVLIK